MSANRQPEDNTVKSLFRFGRTEETPPARQQRQPEPSQHEQAPERHYEAFEAKDKSSKQLLIKTVRQGSFYRSYSYFLGMDYGHDYQSVLTLYFSTLQVTIKGRNLQTLANALENEECKRLFQYDKQRYDPPAIGAAVIEEIDILLPGGEEE